MATKLEQAARQALEALEEIEDLIACYTYSSGLCYAATAALREALDHFRDATKKVAEQAEQEPDDLDWITPEAVFEAKLKLHGIPNPPVQQVDLTEEDINELWNTALMIADPTAGNLRFKFARSVIAKLREKERLK